MMNKSEVLEWLNHRLHFPILITEVDVVFITKFFNHYIPQANLSNTEVRNMLLRGNNMPYIDRMINKLIKDFNVKVFLYNMSDQIKHYE